MADTWPLCVLIFCLFRVIHLFKASVQSKIDKELQPLVEITNRHKSTVPSPSPTAVFAVGVLPNFNIQVVQVEDAAANLTVAAL